MEGWSTLALTKVAQTRKRVISPPGELAQASHISLERDSTKDIGLVRPFTRSSK